MDNWEISKTFSFDFGHRVHNQTLNTEFSLDGHCACKHMHGHTGKVQVYLESDTLVGGFVTDFKHLNWFGKFLDDFIDHKFVLDLNDPWFANIVNAKQNWENGKLVSLTSTQPLNTKEGRELKLIPVFVPNTDHMVGYQIDVSDLSGPEQEYLESYFLVSFVPTSEFFTKWLYEALDAKMSKIGITVSRVSWAETPKSLAVYSRPD